MSLDLRTGRTVWQLDSAGTPAWPDLDASGYWDAIVVGAGISGALTALRLARAGAGVLVLDRRSPASGSTVASTALIQYDIDIPLVKLRECLGTERADRVFRRSAQAVRSLGALVSELDDPADWTWRPSALLAISRNDAELLRRETKARQEIGMDVRLLPQDEVESRFGFRRPAAIWSTLAAEADPRRMALSALRGAEQEGAVIRSGPNAEVRALETRRGRALLHCTGGATLESGFVVMAAGYEAQAWLPYQVARLKSTYVVAFRPEPDLSAWPDRCLLWDTGDPYLYCRTTREGRVIIGGEDIDTVDDEKRDALLERKSSVLQRRARELWPSLCLAPEAAWAGTFAETADGLPVIGICPDGPPHVRFALGYGGNGITFSELASHLLAADYLGKPGPEAPLFAFGRPTLQS